MLMSHIRVMTDALTVQVAGDYSVSFSATMETNGAAGRFEFAIFLNGERQNNCRTAGANSIPISCQLTLAESDQLTVWTRRLGANNSVTVTSASLSVRLMRSSE